MKRIRRLATVGITSGVMAGTFLAAGHATTAVAAVPDAKCEGARTNALADRRVAQPFTAVNTGHLVSFQAEIVNNAPAGTWTVQINMLDGAGKPTNTTLATTTIDVGPTPATGAPSVAGTFPNPAFVTAGAGYAFAIVVSSGTVPPMVDNGNPCPMNVFSDTTLTGSWPISWSAYDLLFATFVEPQQTEPSDTTAPSTTITKAPKNKTRKKKAKFKFTGTDARAVAGFQCSVDGDPFEPCTSPYKVKVKKGKHTFEVRAVDDAGNVGSPDSDRWKRKKKKRK